MQNSRTDRLDRRARALIAPSSPSSTAAVSRTRLVKDLKSLLLPSRSVVIRCRLALDASKQPIFGRQLERPFPFRRTPPQLHDS